MADLSPVEKVVIAGIVAPAFSTQRGKEFTLPPDHEDLARLFSCDLVLGAEDCEVAKFEHTRAAGDEDDKELERVRPDRGGRVLDLLQECLNAHDARGAIITLVTDPPPAGREDQDRLAGWLCGFILKKLREGRLTYFALDVVEDWGYLSFVAKWVKKLVIAPGSPDAPAGIISATSRMGHLIDTAGRFREALERKANRYGAAASDVILLVDFDMFPLQDIDLPEVVETTMKTKHPFREVWAVNNYPGDQRCWRVSPSPTPGETVQGPRRAREGWGVKAKRRSTRRTSG